ncbi:neuromedin-U receptor 2 [Lingula anatina]|uniref:Neuromedin-U receptor 2 n=1 Tax=Lingula anatina TaxID=7574 RepID=A0A1S3KDI3_LINAN|nr:neuromedin-U receptor 2 [Lingula anatina]|eukprot:XP_013420557.1 neuromedin-U receptor 2 [Lingula anatina]
MAFTESYYEYIIAREIWRVFPPLYLCIGTVGNVLTFLVMCRKGMRHLPSALYLAALAVTDTVAIWVGLMRHILKEYNGYDLLRSSLFMCLGQRFVLYFALDASAWILVVVTLERFISVVVPYRLNLKFSMKRARISLIIVAVFTTFQDSYVFFTRGLEYDINSNGTEVLVDVCGFVSPNAKYFWEEILPWYVSSFYVLGPFLSMIILNSFIIRKLFILRKTRLDASVSLSRTSQQSNRDVSCSQQDSERSSVSRPDNTVSFTIMLLWVSFIFLILTFPSTVNLLMEKRIAKESDPHRRAVFALVVSIAHVMNYLNHTVTFFLYCLTGKRFRRELCKMFSDLRVFCSRSRVEPHI